jgi:hypothetical protein
MQKLSLISNLDETIKMMKKKMNQEETSFR